MHFKSWQGSTHKKLENKIDESVVLTNFVEVHDVGMFSSFLACQHLTAFSTRCEQIRRSLTVGHLERRGVGMTITSRNECGVVSS